MNPRRRGVAPGRPAEANMSNRREGGSDGGEEKDGGEIKSEIMF